MSPPTCRITGKHIRYLCLIAVLTYFIYFLITGIKEPTSSRTVYICSYNDDDNEQQQVEEEESMIECQSLDDVTTCSNMIDDNGNAAICIQSSCGYKLFNHIDISIAGSSNPFNVNDATSTTSFLSVVSIFYGLVPYLMGLTYLVLFLAFGDLVPFTRLVVLVVIVIMNDGVFKHVFTQSRPIGSCLYFSSFGMPSGHAATSIGLLTYLLLEMFVYHPNIMFGITCQNSGERLQNTYSFIRGYGWQKQTNNVADGDVDVAGVNVETPQEAPNAAVDSVAIDINESSIAELHDNGIEESNSPSPRPLLESSSLPCSDTRSKWMYHCYAFGYIVLLLPVPFSRVYLHDHFRIQVLAGSCIGIIAAMIWYLCVIRFWGIKIKRWRSSSALARWCDLKCNPDRLKTK